MRVLYVKRRLLLSKNNLVRVKKENFLFNSKGFYSNFWNLRALSIFSTLQNFSSRFPTLAGIDSSYLPVAAAEFFSMLKFIRITFRGHSGLDRILTASAFLNCGFSSSFFSFMKSSTGVAGRNMLNFCLSKVFLFNSSRGFLGLKLDKNYTIPGGTRRNIVAADENLLVFIETSVSHQYKYLNIAGVSGNLFAVTG